jgi:hypothetical protein
MAGLVDVCGAFWAKVASERTSKKGKAAKIPLRIGTLDSSIQKR